MPKARQAWEITKCERGEAGTIIKCWRCWRPGSSRRKPGGEKIQTPALTVPQVQEMIGQLLNGILKCDSRARIRRRMERRLKRNEQARLYHWKRRNRFNSDYAGGGHTEDFARLPNVTLIPHQPRAALPAIINRHAVVLGQALLGAVGMAELEAVSCARPVVAWYRYNHAYAEPPPIVKAVDGFDIATAVERLIDDPAERDRLGDEGRRWIQRYHNLADASGRVEAAAIQLVGHR